MSFHFFISNLIEPISYALCCLSLLFLMSWNKNLKWKFLFVYYFMATLLMLKAAYAETNIELYRILSLLTCLGMGLYFYFTFLTRLKQWIVILFCAIQLLYYMAGVFLFPNHSVFDSTGYVILSMGMIVMAFMYMHQVLTHVTEESLSMSFDFWFVSSLLLYHLGSFLIFLTYGHLTLKIIHSELYSYENRIYLSQLWRGHNILLFLDALIISVSILWISFRRRSLSL